MAWQDDDYITELEAKIKAAEAREAALRDKLGEVAVFLVREAASLTSYPTELHENAQRLRIKAGTIGAALATEEAGDA